MSTRKKPAAKKSVVTSMVERSILKLIYAVYDSVSETYSPMNLHYTRGEAIRSFEMAVQSPESMISKHPSQYTLFELGEYDLVSGEITVYDSQVSVINGAHCEGQLN